MDCYSYDVSFCCMLSAYVMILIFFFFKQKTAYEMRISDWSSDVCSSDLVAVETSSGKQGEMARIVMKFGGTTMAGTERIRTVAKLVAREVAQGNEVAEIGRESCRERVCKYV